MVRNLTGGSGHKSQARKNVVSRGGASGSLRIVQEEGECFAQVERLLGGTNCHVKCSDGVVRLCVIRGKFRGKGKRDNVLSSGSIVLVGFVIMRPARARINYRHVICWRCIAKRTRRVSSPMQSSIGQSLLPHRDVLATRRHHYRQKKNLPS